MRTFLGQDQWQMVPAKCPVLSGGWEELKGYCHVQCWCQMHAWLLALLQISHFIPHSLCPPL